MHRRDINDEILYQININLHWSDGYTWLNRGDNRRFRDAMFLIVRSVAPWLDFTEWVWWLGKYASAIYAMAGSRNIEQNIEISGGRTGFEQYYDWYDIREISYALKWCERWKPRHSGLKMGLNTKIHVAVDACGMSLKILISDWNVHDSQRAEELNKDFKWNTW